MRTPNVLLIDAVKNYLEEKCGAHGSWQESLKDMAYSLNTINPKLNANVDSVFRTIQKLKEDGVIEVTQSDNRDPNTYTWKDGIPLVISESTKQADDDVIRKMVERLAYYREKIFQLESELKVWKEFANTIEKKDIIGNMEVIYRKLQ